MGSFEEFPDSTRYTPMPNPLFGPLLEEIDDLQELKCLLRVLWLHSQKKGFPRFVTWGELVADRTLAKALSKADSGLNEALIEEILRKVLKRGALIHLKVEMPQRCVDVYLPNTREGRRALQHLEARGVMPDMAPDEEALPSLSKPSIFALYEQNIGIITPIIAEELKEAEESYPQEWIEEAFREAALRNKRSWRYINAILRRWSIEGKGYGESERHPKKIDAQEWIRRYGLPRSSR